MVPRTSEGPLSNRDRPCLNYLCVSTGLRLASLVMALAIMLVRLLCYVCRRLSITPLRLLWSLTFVRRTTRLVSLPLGRLTQLRPCLMMLVSSVMMFGTLSVRGFA